MTNHRVEENNNNNNNNDMLTLAQDKKSGLSKENLDQTKMTNWAKNSYLFCTSIFKKKV